MKKTDKSPYIIGGVIILLVASIIVYVYLQTNTVDFPIKRFALIVGGIVAGLGIVGFILYHFLSSSSTKDKEISSPKEYVSSSRALQIWKEEFIKYNKIPYIIPHWMSDQDIVPVDKNSVEFRDTKAFNDPSHQTSDKFYAFEVVVREGDKTGILVACIRLDLGEEYLRGNWNERMRWNHSMNTYSTDNKRFPLSSAKSYAERLGMKRIEMAEEGWSEREINEIINPFLASQKSGESMIAQTERRREPIRSPGVKDAFLDYPDDEEEGVDSDDLQEDIQAFRRANK